MAPAQVDLIRVNCSMQVSKLRTSELVNRLFRIGLIVCMGLLMQIVCLAGSALQLNHHA